MDLNLQEILTKGLDAASSYYTEKLRINDPTPYVTGPNGERVPVGQMSGLTSLQSVPSWILPAAAVVGVVLLVVVLIRK